MNFSNLRKTSDIEIENWLHKNLDLTDAQYQKMIDTELIRFSKFHFYKWQKKENTTFLWRITIIAFPFYIILLILFLPFNFLFTGHWHLKQNFLDNFHSKWISKIRK